MVRQVSAFFFLLLFLIIQCSWYDDIWLLKMFILKQQLNADRMRFFKKMFWRSCKETKKQQRLMEFRYKNVEVISCYVDLKRERRRKKKFPFSLYGLHQVNIYIYPLQINNAFIAESDRQFQWKSWFVNEITKNYWEKKHFFLLLQMKQAINFRFMSVVYMESGTRSTCISFIFPQPIFPQFIDCIQERETMRERHRDRKREKYENDQWINLQAKIKPYIH